MNSLLALASVCLLAGQVQNNKKDNVNVAPKGNVNVAPRGNVDRAPTGNVGNYPRGNVDRYPSGNVGVAPRSNVDRFPTGGVGTTNGGNVDVVPSADSGNTPVDPTAAKATRTKRGDAKEKSKTGSDGETKSKKTAHKKKDDKSDDKKKEPRPGVTGPIIFGYSISSNLIVSDLERVRLRLNSIGNDYEGRRTAAVLNVTHAIHMLRYGRSDPNAEMSIVVPRNFETRAVSDNEVRVVLGKLQHVAGLLRSNAYLYGSPALDRVDRAIDALEGALEMPATK